MEGTMKLSFCSRKSGKTLEEIGNRCGTDKTRRHGYHRFYPLFLEQYRDKQIAILEVGLYRGASLDMWLEYFPFAFVYGLDIDGPELRGERFHVMKGDQSDVRCLSHFDGKDIDLIVDDGSHVPEHQLSTFSFLFSKALKDGGTYVIEDIETSYWRNGTLYGYKFEYGYGARKSTVEAFKHAADFVNDEFLRDSDKKQRNDSCAINEEVMGRIATVTFAQNCIVVQKKRTEHSRYDNREYRRREFL
jgi:hypothetical protein